MIASVIALSLGILAAPLAADAQQAGKVYRIGYLQTSTREQQLHLIKAFEDGLRELGYVVGQNVVIEYRFAEAKLERITGLAGDAGDEIFGKRLELLKDILPRLSRVAVLWNPDFAPNRGRWKAKADAARKLGLTLLSVETRGLKDLERGFASRSPGPC